MVIARGVGRGAQNIDISLLPHCENRISGYENIAYISHIIIFKEKSTVCRPEVLISYVYEQLIHRPRH